LGLPDDDGQNLLKGLREWYSRPIIIVSARSAEAEIVEALDRGANDYLVKPFRTGELLARIRSALRQGAAEPSEPLKTFGNLSIDLVARVVKKNDEVVKLTSTEYALLVLFVKNEGKVLTHPFILREVWGPGYVERSEYPRVFVGQLRKKIEDTPHRPTLILTESGIGYRFVG
jgi:two-component system, OmpR family, KDP operon response regulator KdpE